MVDTPKKDGEGRRRRRRRTAPVAVKRRQLTNLLHVKFIHACVSGHVLSQFTQPFKVCIKAKAHANPYLYAGALAGSTFLFTPSTPQQSGPRSAPAPAPHSQVYVPCGH